MVENFDEFDRWPAIRQIFLCKHLSFNFSPMHETHAQSIHQSFTRLRFILKVFPCQTFALYGSKYHYSYVRTLSHVNVAP